MLTIPNKFAELLTAQLKKAAAWQTYNKEGWNFDEDALLKHATADQLAAVKSAAAKALTTKEPGASKIYREFKELERRARTMEQLSASKEGTFNPQDIEVHDLKSLSIALKDAVAKSSVNRWIFVKIKDYLFTPVLVTNINHTPGSRRSPEQLEISIAAVFGRDEPKFCTRSFRVYDRVFGERLTTLQREVENEDDDDDGETTVNRAPNRRHKGTTLDKVIKRVGFFLSNATLMAEYEKNYAAYAKIANTCGKQMVAENSTVMGMMVDDDDWWSRAKLVSMTVDDVLSRCVMDDTNEESYESSFEKATGFSHRTRDEELDEIGNFWNLKHPVLPTLPVVRVFNMKMDQHVFVAASDVIPYQYDSAIWDKLVLPDADLDFIHILLSSSQVNINDIVHGKARGIIVLCSGAPGLGKTLTAEASSEAFEKPLYSVQCSQLGINPEELEENLLLTLRRAQRWSAILLLDESDVYVRRRGSDLDQNAIVGVFLRVLEYYRGILFMTTNLGGDIDDAILSRTTAHLRYNLPTEKALPELWRVLSAQLSVNFTDEDLKKLVAHFGSIPGRSIRNLVKLARYFSVSKKIKPDAAMVIKVAKYLNVESKT